MHCFAAGELLGVPGCSAIVDAGLTALWERHRDPERGGYVTAVPRGRTMAPSLVGAIRRSQAGPAVERVEHAGPR